MTLIKSVNNVEIKEAKVVKPLEKKRKSLAIMSSLEYLNSDIGKPREFLIDRLIPQGSIGMLVAPAKTNKTTIAYDIALSVATGKDCMGHTTNIEGKVLYICIEGSLQGLIQAFGYSDNIDIVPDKYFQWEEYREELESLIEEREYKLIVLDPLYKATKCDISKADKVRPFLIDIEQIANKYNTTILLCHHTMRGDNLSAEQTVNNISGSMHLVRASEFTIMLEREKKTEEEEQQELNLSDEEYENLPQKRILRKMDYRYGGEGYTKHLITIDFKNGAIDGQRYSSNGLRVKPKARIEDLFNHAVEILERFDVIDKGILTSELAKIYTDLTKNTITKHYINDVWTKLEKTGKIDSVTKYKYRIVRDNL